MDLIYSKVIAIKLIKILNRYLRWKNYCGFYYHVCSIQFIAKTKARIGTFDEAIAQLNGTAKQQEEIFLPYRRDSVRMPPESLGLKLIQRIRDEAHRFAISYHRKLRGQHVFTNN